MNEIPIKNIIKFFENMLEGRLAVRLRINLQMRA